MGGKEREEFDLGALLGKICGQYADRHTVTLISDDTCSVKADAEALEQALVHLVQNAIEVSDENSPVLLELRKESGSAVIEIVDSGEGMSPDFIRTKLFKPFHSSKPGGFGIGAYEARELVRAMGGRLDVESREGLGTRFVLRLPLSEASDMLRVMQDNSKEVA